MIPDIPATATAVARPSPRAQTARLLFIDNIRWVMIMLVLSMHAAVTYSGVGSWYYNEGIRPRTPELLVFVTYQAFLQSFFMGLLFFIAGYFVPGAYDKKGARRFLRDRAFRLGWPSLLYVFLIGPLTEYYVSGSWAGGSADRSFLREYGHYITRLRFPGGTGPLWFCVALLVFCFLYAAGRLFAGRTSLLLKRIQGTPRPFPGTPGVTGFILLIAIASFFVRIPWPNGTSFYNMQFCYFPQYIAFFIAGTLAYRQSWLTTLSKATGKGWGIAARAGGLVFWFSLLWLGGAVSGHRGDFSGGLHWQSFGLCLWEAFVGTGLSIFVLALFRQKFNRQGRWASYFSDNAFAVYVFHPPILIGITLAMAGLHWIPLLKFVLATLLCIVASFAFCSLIARRLPLLKRIL
ncbi:MAG TPA: acyltransferase family protein [Puia sp.]|nr:acyltransferase family protein [Puia sp.]